MCNFDFISIILSRYISLIFVMLNNLRLWVFKDRMLLCRFFIKRLQNSSNIIKCLRWDIMLRWCITTIIWYSNRILWFWRQHFLIITTTLEYLAMNGFKITFLLLEGNICALTNSLRVGILIIHSLDATKCFAKAHSIIKGWVSCSICSSSWANIYREIFVLIEIILKITLKIGSFNWGIYRIGWTIIERGWLL